MKLGGKSKICDGNNRTGSALFGGIGEVGGGWFRKKWGICNLQTGDQILMKFDLDL